MRKVLRCHRPRKFRGPGAVVEFCLLRAWAAYPTGLLFNPSMPAAAIQDQIDKVYSIQRNSEFGPARHALLFLPGAYHVDVPVGYRSEVLGLGDSPDRVHIAGNVHSDATLPRNNATCP